VLFEGGQSDQPLNSTTAVREHPQPQNDSENIGVCASMYDHVRATLELVEAGDLSRRKAASELDTSRRTINRALVRPELYSL
jgi:hypothetical protein